MKATKIGLTLILTLFLISQSSFAQEQDYTYAYVSVNGKLFGKKLKVKVDFGDKPEQIAKGEKYSELLNNKKSYAAVLNFMVETGFELVETLDYVFLYSGSGGTSGIVFIMRRKQ
jgi:hypothetical protein